MIISTIFIALTLFALYFLKYGRSRSTDFVLVVSGAAPYGGTDLEGVIRRHSADARVRSHEVEEGAWEVIFELKFPRLAEAVTKQLLQEIQALPGVRRVSLLAPQLALPV